MNNGKNGNHNATFKRQHQSQQVPDMPDKINGAASAASGSTEIPDSPVMRMYDGLFDIGRARAIASGALEPNPTDLTALQEHAAAMARETRRDLYDPKNKHQDRLRDEKYKKWMADRTEAELAVKHSAAEVRDKEQALGRLPASDRPQAAFWLMAALIVGIAATIAPTLHDFLFASVEDNAIGWLFSIMSAGFLAGVIVWGILGSIDATGRRNATNWMGLGGGIVISCGLGLLRWSTAMEPEEVILAIALTAIEIGLIVITEWVASGLRHHFIEWKEQQTAHDQAMAALDAAKNEHQRRQEKLNELNTNITDHIRYVEERDLRNVNVTELIAAAAKAVTDGYNQGIATNVGRVIGTVSPASLPPKPPAGNGSVR